MRRVEFMLLLLCAAPATAGETTLRVATWGGAYERVQQEVLFDPFTEQTGIRIQTVAYAGGLQILAGDPGTVPDLVDMGASEAIAACRRGRIRPLDTGDLADGEDGAPARRDFIPGALRRCSVTHTVYATVIAFDSRAFPGRRPTRAADLFDLETFPGKRALRPEPAANLEWALVSWGVPRRELYPLLSTPRGLDLAFRRLQRLDGQVVWWRDGRQPVELLEAGEVVMASGFNGRFFSARLDGGSPIEILWDSQIQEHQTWVIPRDGDAPGAAWQFIRFATGTGPLAALAERIAYGPARKSASARIGRHPETGMDMRVHIPTHPYNTRTAIEKDVDWYARTLDRVRQRFEEWRSGLAGADDDR